MLGAMEEKAPLENHDTFGSARSADFGPMANPIIGIIALIECPVSIAFFVMIFGGFI